MLPDRQNHSERLVQIAAIIILAIASVTIILIMGGVFDPKPAGPLRESTKLGQFSLGQAGEVVLIQLESPFANHHPGSYSVRLTSEYVSGETDSGYGLVLGNEDERIFVAVSPLGEAAVWRFSSTEEIDYQVAWQPWPHVRQGSIPNEIWLDVDGSEPNLQVTARINRELIWRGSVEAITPAAALWLAAFDGPFTVKMTELEWFSEIPTAPIVATLIATTPLATTPLATTPMESAPAP
ncbi:MAG: hypothetical protein R6X18_06500 [Chloroflexota bacterium]|jgi:hypothetical protein